MFDAETSRFLRSAPPVPDLDPEMIPALLTQHYAELASSRLRGNETSPSDTTWPLERIADTYELIASTQRESRQGPQPLSLLEQRSKFLPAGSHCDPPGSCSPTLTATGLIPRSRPPFCS